MDDLGPFQGLGLMMQIGYLVAALFQVIGQILRHADGQGGNQHPFPGLDAGIELVTDIVDLAPGRLDPDQRVEQPGRPDDLFHDFVTDMVQFIITRGRRTVDDLVDHAFKFVKAHGPVIQGAGQPEAVLDQHFLALPVTVVHAADLRQGDMGLIHDQQVIIREVIKQVIRTLARHPAVNMHRVVLDTGTVAVFPQRFQVKPGALFQPFLFQRLAFLLKILQPFFQLRLDIIAGPEHLLMRAGIAGRREDVVELVGIQYMPGQRVHFGNPLDFIPEHLNPDIELVCIRRHDFDHIPAHPQGAAALVHVIAHILTVDELPQQGVAFDFLADPDREEHVLVLFRIAGRVDARHRGNDDRIPPFNNGVNGRLAEHIQFFVDRRGLFDIHVVFRHVRFRLIVIKIRNKVFHPVVREEFLEFGIQLAGQGLVVGKDQCRPVYPGNDIGHGKGFAGAGGTFQNLFFFSFLQPADQLVNRFRLIPGRMKRGNQFKAVSH